VTDFLSILNVVLPVYLVMGLGGGARKLGILAPEVDKSMMRLCVTILTPCLIFQRVVGNDSVMHPGPVLVAAGLGFGLVTLGIAVSYFLAPLAGLSVGQGRRTFAVGCGLQNYGFVAIPIVSALFHDPGTLGVLFTFTLGVELACWLCAVGLMTGLGSAPWKLALNPPVIAILLSLALNFSGLHQFVPEVIHNFFGMVGACAVPLAVLLIGAAIADLWGQEKLNWGIAIASPILRLFIVPLAFIAAAYWLPLSIELKRILVVQAAMPSAVFNIMIARHYGGHAPTAVQVVLSTTIVSLATTPLVISWGLRVVGLVP